MKRGLSLVLFLVLVLGGGLVIGSLVLPGDWYAALVKPSFNPPNRIFGPVWSALYVLIAIVGWRTWERDSRGWAMRIWWTQLALNFLWSPVFFSAHQVGLAIAVILMLLVAVVTFVALSWRQDRPSAMMFVPYAAWVAFASVLNASVLVLNS